MSKGKTIKDYIQKSKEDWWSCKCGSYHKGFPYKCPVREVENRCAKETASMRLKLQRLRKDNKSLKETCSILSTKLGAKLIKQKAKKEGYNEALKDVDRIINHEQFKDSRRYTEGCVKGNEEVRKFIEQKEDEW